MTRDGVRIELPFPPKELSPNARVHWRTKAVVVANYRSACGWSGAEVRTDKRFRRKGTTKPIYRTLHRNGWPLTPPVSAVVTFVVPNRHKRDEDNLLAMLKPAWDGLVDAGVLSGDDSERFSVENAIVIVGAEEPMVIVVLRSL